ncbi:MAG: NUDIX domain-containing protein [Cohaesibacteraceae bacterium]
MAVRPRQAASLIALWTDGTGSRHLLMGKRGESLRFLPGYLVFPGGRLERQDWVKPNETDGSSMGLDAKHRSALDREWVKHRLASMTRLSPADALLNAALRECLEETGIDLSRSIDGRARYVGRAVTPPGGPIRFDTRFFLVRILSEGAPPAAQQLVDGELLSTGWRSLEEIACGKVHHITRGMLDHAIAVNEGADDLPLLIADRTPKHWSGKPALRSRNLRAPNPDQT